MKPTLIVILVRPQGPVNLGLSARACANFGVELRLVRPLCPVDVPEARQFANHAKDLLLGAPVFDGLAEAVADCDYVLGTSGERRQRGFIDPMGPQRLPALLRDAEQCALVFGNEADGLSNDELKVCQGTLRLPTPGAYASFNLSHAVALTLFASLAEDEAPESPPETRGKVLNAPATHGEIDELGQAWLELLDGFGYFRRTDRERFAPKLRAMLGRFRLMRHDAGLLRGMVAHLSRSVPPRGA